MARKSQQVSNSILAKLQKARIARLATLDAQRRPHIVPVCFVYDGSVFYTAVDRKPKSVPPEKLTRLRNIAAAPQVALLIDEYSEDWAQLWFILVRGQAKLIASSAVQERAGAIRRLKDKYPQYALGMLAEDAPIVRITPERVSSWGRI
jgi:coenzyme F420-0:L-glutamate ligase / coenzyme F420-1:gamma-L-glutamate ligase